MKSSIVTWNFKRGAWTSTMSPNPSMYTMPLNRSAGSSRGVEGVEGRGGRVWVGCGGEGRGWVGEVEWVVWLGMVKGVGRVECEGCEEEVEVGGRGDICADADADREWDRGREWG